MENNTEIPQKIKNITTIWSKINWTKTFIKIINGLRPYFQIKSISSASGGHGFWGDPTQLSTGHIPSPCQWPMVELPYVILAKALNSWCRILQHALLLSPLWWLQVPGEAIIRWQSPPPLGSLNFCAEESCIGCSPGLEWILNISKKQTCAVLSHPGAEKQLLRLMTLETLWSRCSPPTSFSSACLRTYVLSSLNHGPSWGHRFCPCQGRSAWSNPASDGNWIWWNPLGKLTKCQLQCQLNNNKRLFS